MKDTYQVVVIGGGIVGASVLFHLAKLGWTGHWGDGSERRQSPASRLSSLAAAKGRFDLRRFSQARMTANGKFAALPKILRCGSEGFLRQQ